MKIFGRNSCTHEQTRGVYGDEINQARGKRLCCVGCGRYINGDLSSATHDEYGEIPTKLIIFSEGDALSPEQSETVKRLFVERYGEGVLSAKIDKPTRLVEHDQPKEGSMTSKRIDLTNSANHAVEQFRESLAMILNSRKMKVNDAIAIEGAAIDILRSTVERIVAEDRAEQDALQKTHAKVSEPVTNGDKLPGYNVNLKQVLTVTAIGADANALEAYARHSARTFMGKRPGRINHMRSEAATPYITTTDGGGNKTVSVFEQEWTIEVQFEGLKDVNDL